MALATRALLTTDRPQLQSFRCPTTGENIEILVQKGPIPNESFVLWSDIQNVFENARYIRNGKILVPFMKDNNNNRISPRRIGYYPGVVLEVITESDNQPASTLEQTYEELLARLEQIEKLLSRNHEEVLGLHRQTHNKLGVIMNQVKALLTQTYELHEYPIPRLFIVLPQSTRLRDKLANPFSEQFRLYFLCECGTHTMLDGNITPPEVHLAKHEGYELEKPKEFFENYGSYIMAMMCMIRYGIIAGGIVVPSLANFKILEGLDTAQKHMEYLKKNIAPLVDDTISFLQDIKRNDAVGDELSSDHTEFDKLEALEGTDLRQLESYLKIKDKGRMLGNLYRIVTPEGHVKWVCLHHYRTSYRESAMDQLRDTVHAHQGIFIDETGRVEIGIATSALARAFYEVLVKARGVQELQIKLGWDVTMDDLRILCDAVTKANVIHLTVDGTNFKSPSIDIVNRGRRFDPILRLASNARIQSLQLIGFDEFFSRVTKYKLSAPKLRVFSIEWMAPLNGKAIKFLNGFLEHCPGLNALGLKFNQQYPTTRALMDTFPKIHQLKTLRLDYGRFSLTTSFIQGKVQGTSVTIPGLGILNSDDLKFIHQVQFIRLVVESIPPSHADATLSDIFRHSQGHSHLRIEGRTFSGTNSQTLMNLQNLMKLLELTAMSKLESLSIDFGKITLSANSSQGAIRDMTVEFDRLDDLTPDDLQFIQQGCYSQLVIEHTLKDDEGRLVEILRQSPLLSYRQFRCNEGRCLAKASKINMDLQDLVNLALSETPSSLESFSVGCQRIALTADFSEDRMEDIAMTIERLDYLSSSDINFIHHGQLRQLMIESTPLLEDEERLTDILRHNPLLNRLQVRHQGRSSIPTTLELPLRALLKLAASETLNQLRLFSISNKRFDFVSIIPRSKIDDMAITIKSLADLTEDDLTFFEQGYLTHFALEFLPRGVDAERISGILRHFPGLTQLKIKFKDEGDIADGVRLDTIFRDMMDMVSLEAHTNLQSLKIDYKNVSTNANIVQGRIQDIYMKIERLSDIDSDIIEATHQGRLTRLVVGDTPRETDGDRLVQLLRHHPDITQLQIERKESRPSDILLAPKMKLQDIVQLIMAVPLSKLQTLKIDCERLSYTAGVSNGEIQSGSVIMEQFRDFGIECFKFVQFIHLTKLAFKLTPQKPDEGQLTEILHRCPLLNHLQVGCKEEHSLGIVNLMVSIREKVTRHGSPFCLHAFELMDENLVPFNILDDRDRNTHIQSHLTFSKGSNTFDMRTWIRLATGATSERPCLNYAFIRQYGWSIVFFRGFLRDNNIIATLLDNIPNVRTSRLESLSIHCNDIFDDEGNNQLDKIIKQSPNFKDLRMYVCTKNEDDFQRALSSLDRYGAILSGLEVFDGFDVSRIASSFPTRKSFPELESFEVQTEFNIALSPNFSSWIAAMVSAPPQGLPPHSASQNHSLNIVGNQGAQTKPGTTRSWTPLRRIALNEINLQPEEWERVIEAMDFSALEYLGLALSNIAQEQFEMLIGRVADNGISNLPLKTLEIGLSAYSLSTSTDPDVWKVMAARLRKKAPLAEIKILGT
ncbi:hypothetical protein BGX34_010565 [Mortierella sp. NVP85]|nr:hypothetical protein BGX34_010565 [Mortierella sp. NVP85]